jgi:hypothetical protein
MNRFFSLLIYTSSHNRHPTQQKNERGREKMERKDREKREKVKDKGKR